MSRIKLDEIEVNVLRKDIKNIHLGVHPPSGRVRISAPSHMKLDTIRVFAISRLNWIKQQQRKVREQARETPREFVERESHYLWGKRCLMKVVEADEAPSTEPTHSKMILQVRPGTGRDRREAILDRWYRDQLKTSALPLIASWERTIGIKVNRLFVQRMKTK